MRDHCQHPFIERFCLAEFAQIAQGRRQSRHGGQMLRGVPQDQLVQRRRSLQREWVFPGLVSGSQRSAAVNGLRSVGAEFDSTPEGGNRQTRIFLVLLLDLTPERSLV